MKRYNSPILKATRKVLYGYVVCKMLHMRYGKDTHIFLVRGKTGDIFLYFRFLEAYIREQEMEHYLIIGDGKGLKAIQKLYPTITGRCIAVTKETGEALQSAYCFWGENHLKMTLSLMWDVDLPYNRCAVRLTTPFNFIDSYYWFLFHLNRDKAEPTKAVFQGITTSLEQRLIGKGVEPGNTVILSPYAYCVRCLPTLFWTLLGKDLEHLGYTVLVMLDEKNEKNEFGFPSIFFTYSESAAVLKYAGHFIGLRSGFCDIIAETECNKVILYPVKPKRFNGSVHRADAEYSSFANMELAMDALEITVPFCRDVTNFESETENLEEHIAENRTVIEKILSRFPARTRKVVC